MKRIIEKIVSILKGDPSYTLDNTYSSKQLVHIIWYRGIQILRGYLLKVRITSDGVIFCGRNVIILHGYQFKAGKSFIVEDGVHINALSIEGVVVGNNVTIARNSILACTGVIANKGKGIKIGNNSAVGAQSFVGGQGGVKIGNDVIMGPQVKIFSENHVFSNADTLIRKQGESRNGVVIEDNCWIGAGTTILDGVTIATGCIVAAGSVVNKSIPKNSIAAGVPAKVIKSRI